MSAEDKVVLRERLGLIRPMPVQYLKLMIMVIVLSFNLLGDGLRDALAPRLSHGSQAFIPAALKATGIHFKKFSHVPPR